MNSRVTELRLAGVAFALLAILFVAWPQLDIAASSVFFDADGRWFLYRGEPAVLQWLYLGVPPAGQSLLALLALGLLLGCLPRFAWLRSRRTIFGFTLAAALLGPVLVVDAGLKNYWGRARPQTVEAFGGTRHFTPAHFVRRIEVSYAGRTLLTADVDFALSENPQLRFRFAPQEGGELQAKVIDSKDLTFTQTVAVKGGALASSK